MDDGGFALPKPLKPVKKSEAKDGPDKDSSKAAIQNKTDENKVEIKESEPDAAENLPKDSNLPTKPLKTEKFKALAGYRPNEPADSISKPVPRPADFIPADSKPASPEATVLQYKEPAPKSADCKPAPKPAEPEAAVLQYKEPAPKSADCKPAPKLASEPEAAVLQCKEPAPKSADCKPAPKPAEPEVAVLQYKEPKWSGPAAFPYTLEVLKNGRIVDEIDISEWCCVTVGRLPACDVSCLHPSISRYHAVFQHRSPEVDKPGAVFLYDLGSSYGTTVNKVKITPRTYYMMKTGHVIKFGASTRLYIVKGPPQEAFDDEAEMVPEPEAVNSSETVDKAKKLGILASEEAEIMLEMLNSRERDIDETAGDNEGISWGFREDAPEEDDGELKLDLTKMSRPADFKDPKKTLRGFFEREGVELEYVVTESGVGKQHQYICKVELPIDAPHPVFAEGISSGKKKDAVLTCALHGCRLLDAYGVLRSSRRNEDIETRNEKLAKNDFYDSDEDTFLDRTGEVEHKRKRRMLRAGVEENKGSKTHNILTEDLRQMNEEIRRIQRVVSESTASKEVGEDVDELEAYMLSVSETTVTTGAMKEMKKKLYDLKVERVKLERMCEMAKPIALPEVKRLSAVPKNVMTGKVGKVSAPKQFSTATAPTTTTNPAEVQPVKKISIKLSLKSAPQLPNTTKEPAPEPESGPEPSCPTKVTEITEFSSETSGKIEQSASKTDKPSDSAVDSVKPEPSQELVDSEPTTLQEAKKPPKKKARKSAPQTATLTDNVQWDDDIHDENFVNWTPPVGQTGDGWTKLNEKFGY